MIVYIKKGVCDSMIKVTLYMHTAWKVSKYGPGITMYFDNFHAVVTLHNTSVSGKIAWIRSRNDKLCIKARLYIPSL